MHYQLIPPAPELASFVKSFWILEGCFSVLPVDTYRLMANGYPEMAFHYDNRFKDGAGRPLSLASLDGPTENFKEFQVNGHFGIVGVCFYPYAIQQLFNVSIKELACQSYDLESVLGKDGKILMERILLAPNHSKRFELLTDFLLEKASRSSTIDPNILDSVQKIYARKGRINIDEVTENVWLSRRQFERKFNEWIGIRPKLLTRLIRFQASLKMKQYAFPSLTALAHHCGYFDQSHFIRDFKAFAGMSPGQYFNKIEESADNFVSLQGVHKH